jgi:hypothetical protein
MAELVDLAQHSESGGDHDPYTKNDHEKENSIVSPTQRSNLERTFSGLLEIRMLFQQSTCTLKKLILDI